MPTTLRIALLAGLLALLSNLSVIGFIYWRTHDEALSQIRQQVVEQDKVLMDVLRSGGPPALSAAIADAASDPQAVVGIVGQHGPPSMGNIAGLACNGPIE